MQLDINGLDKDNRTALHWAAISGYGGDLEQVNSTRIRNPQYANASFTWTEAVWAHPPLSEETPLAVL